MGSTTDKNKRAGEGTIKRLCACDSEYQDQTYGPGVRVHNNIGNNKGARCTVCGTVKGA